MMVINQMVWQICLMRNNINYLTNVITSPDYDSTYWIHYGADHYPGTGNIAPLNYWSGSYVIVKDRSDWWYPPQ